MKLITRSTFLLFASLLVASGSLAGCASGTSADPAQLEGEWTLEAFGGASELEPAAADVTTTLKMSGGTANGSGGVNSFSAEYEAPEGDAVTFGPVTSTMMAGPEPAMEQEARFFKVLEDTERFEINDGKLVLSGEGSDTLAVLVPR